MVAEESGDDTGEGLDLAVLPASDLSKMIKALEKEKQKAAQALEFEKAAALRDQIFDLRGALAEKQGEAGGLLVN